MSYARERLLERLAPGAPVPEPSPMPREMIRVWKKGGAEHDCTYPDHHTQSAYFASSTLGYNGTENTPVWVVKEGALTEPRTVTPDVMSHDDAQALAQLLQNERQRFIVRYDLDTPLAYAFMAFQRSPTDVTLAALMAEVEAHKQNYAQEQAQEEEERRRRFSL